MKPSCAHEQFRADVDVHLSEDVGRFFADVRIRCVQCNEPFRFIGVPAGLSWEAPRVSIDGLELHAPIEPEFVKILHERATFQMPPEIPS